MSTQPNPICASGVVKIVIATMLLMDSANGFGTVPNGRRSWALAASLENMISGITGQPPSQPLLNDSLKASLLKGTSLEGVKLDCAYKASNDGWSAIDFHRSVDDRGSGLVIALSRSGLLFGGFNPLGWRSTDDYYNSNAAFLWHLKGNNVLKCPILPGGNTAVFDYTTGGPCFGASDLIIGEPKAAVMGGFAGPDMMDTSANAGSLKSGRCSGMGGSYDMDAGGRWPIRGDFSLVQLEVYCNSKFVASSSGQGSPKWWPF